MLDRAHAVMPPVMGPAPAGHGGFRPDERAELSWIGAERGGDRECAASFGESEPQGQSCRCCPEGEREAELDARETLEVDGGEAGPDDLATGHEIGHGAVGTQLSAQPLGYRAGVSATGVDQERADGVAAGRLRDVAGVGDQEAVGRRCGELFGHADVVEGNVDGPLGVPSCRRSVIASQPDALFAETVRRLPTAPW